ncbi:MAG: hypothetical protein ACQESC_04000 [Nanobdellota archaeon]
MTSFLNRELFASLAKTAKDLNIQPVFSTPVSKKNTFSSNSISTRNTRRIKKYRERVGKEELFSRLARDILEKKRHRYQLEQAVSSLDSSLSKHLETLDSRSTSETTISSQSPLSQSINQSSTNDSTTKQITQRLISLSKKLEQLHSSKHISKETYHSIHSKIVSLLKKVDSASYVSS